MKCVKATIFSDVDGKGGYQSVALIVVAAYGRNKVVVWCLACNLKAGISIWGEA